MKRVILGSGPISKHLQSITNWSRIENETKWNIYSTNSYKLLDSFDEIINTSEHISERETDREVIRKLNIKGTLNLINYCNSTAKKLIQLSTDKIYSLEKTSENDIPGPFSNWNLFYQSIRDEIIQNQISNHSILRFSYYNHPWKDQTAPHNIETTSDYMPVIASLIHACIETNCKGVINIGTDKKTIYDLAKQSNTSVIGIDSKIYKNHIININKLVSHLKK